MLRTEIKSGVSEIMLSLWQYPNDIIEFKFEANAELVCRVFVALYIIYGL